MRITAAVLGFLLLLMPMVAAAEGDHPRPFDGNYDAMPVVDAALAQARAEEQHSLQEMGQEAKERAQARAQEQQAVRETEHEAEASASATIP